MWNGPNYARVSHRLHHRYTMVRGDDPETDWPDVITSKWLRQFLLKQVLRLLLVYAVIDLIRSATSLVMQVTGKLNPIMNKHCSAKNRKAIRIDALIILLFHLAVLVLVILLQKWELIFFIILPWHIGVGMETMWHNTEHIGRLYNVNDQRLATRSIRVGPFIGMIYGGLDDHVDHHMFPVVPSYNLPRLHQALKDNLATPRTVFGCWAEMIAIAKEKDSQPTHEYVPVGREQIE
jgi:fatty acid desaturase